MSGKIKKTGTLEEFKSGKAQQWVGTRGGKKQVITTAAELADYEAVAKKKREPTTETKQDLIARRKLLEMSKDFTALDKISLDYERGLVTKKAIDSPEFSTVLAEKVGKELTKAADDATKKLTDALNKPFDDLGKLSEDLAKSAVKISDAVKTELGPLSKEIKEMSDHMTILAEESGKLLRSSEKMQDDNGRYVNTAVKEMKDANSATIDKLNSANVAAQKVAKAIEKQAAELANQADIKGLRKDINTLRADIVARMATLPTPLPAGPLPQSVVTAQQTALETSQMAANAAAAATPSAPAPAPATN